MYRDTDYLNYTDLNEVEERIKEQHEILECVNISTPDFHPKNWKLNDFPYIQEIDRIERGVNDLGEYYYKPNGWQECKIWLTGKETSQIIKSFSYLDINRWINNYSLMKNIFSGYKFEKINGTKIKINSLINQKAKSLTIDGKSTQETSGAMPSPDYPSEIKNVDGIRNLFNKNITKYDKSNVADSYNTITENETGITYKTTYPDSYSNIHFKYLDLRQYVGKKISFKTDFTINENATEAICRLEYADNNLSSIKTIVSSTISGEKLSFVVPSITELGDTYYLAIMFAIGVKTTGDKILTLTNTMLTIEDSCDTYVPYGSNYLPIVNRGNSLSKTTLIDLKGNELCSIGEVKDELIIKDGKAKINKRFGKIVLNGNESGWLENSVTKGLFQITLKNVTTDITKINAMSNYFKGSSAINIVNSWYTNNSVSTYTSNRLFFRSNEYANNLDGFKTFLSTHNTTVYYELAKPYEVDLGDYNIELFDGVNNISLDDDLDTNMECEYIKEIGDYTTIWNLQSFIKWNESSDLEWSDL